MRYVLEVLIFSAMIVFYLNAWHAGYEAGKRQTTQIYESIIAQRVEDQVRDTRRVMAIREKRCQKGGD